ncbi:hypothetical protein BVY01_04350, partial [bacterium I07]
RKRLHGSPIIGKVDYFVKVSRKKHVKKIIIATPSASARQMRKIVQECEKTGVKFRTVPGIKELMNKQLTLKELRDVQIEDLLQRSPASTDREELGRFVIGKRILVTGAAGSIGSEICNQLIEFGLERLVLMDRIENDLFFLEHDLKSKTIKNCEFDSVIADINRYDRLHYLLNKIKPDIIFHAAAYKHVPLMEMNPAEAVYNNVFGTMNLLKIANEIGVERFIFISSDKAVNPSNIMGATKRLGEIMCLHAQENNRVEYIVVRFGNVLGSKGSLIPLLKKQIKLGGPITITDKDIVRYFMTIPEAVNLVLHAGRMGKGGDIYILNMGEPVNVYEMAQHLVNLSGLELGKDIDIEIVGLRPGEKLFEELWHEDESPIPTTHPMILKSQKVSTNGSMSDRNLLKLKKTIESHNEKAMMDLIRKMVPTYSPSP